MPEDMHTQAGAPGAPTGQQPQAGTSSSSSSSTPPSAPQAGTDATTAATTQAAAAASGKYSPEDAERMIAELRKESASYRTKLKAFEDAQKAADDAKLSEQEKLAKRAEDAEKALGAARQRVGRAELRVAAQAAGIIDPDDAVAHILGKLTYDEAGEPQDVEKLVEALKAAKPHLFTATPTPAGAGQPAGAGRPAATSGGAASPSRSQAQQTPHQRDLKAQPLRRLTDVEWSR